MHIGCQYSDFLNDIQSRTPHEQLEPGLFTQFVQRSMFVHVSIPIGMHMTHTRMIRARRDSYMYFCRMNMYLGEGPLVAAAFELLSGEMTGV